MIRLIGSRLTHGYVCSQGVLIRRSSCMEYCTSLNKPMVYINYSLVKVAEPVHTVFVHSEMKMS